jgi:hypothetical protein
MRADTSVLRGNGKNKQKMDSYNPLLSCTHALLWATEEYGCLLGSKPSSESTQDRALVQHVLVSQTPVNAFLLRALLTGLSCQVPPAADTGCNTRMHGNNAAASDL